MMCCIVGAEKQCLGGGRHNQIPSLSHIFSASYISSQWSIDTSLSYIKAQL